MALWSAAEKVQNSGEPSLDLVKGERVTPTPYANGHISTILAELLFFSSFSLPRSCPVTIPQHTATVAQ